jgi:KRAB domain-containing zinc finger protein
MTECKHCGKKLATPQTLRYHIKTTHLAKDYKCPKCGKQYGNLQLFKTHMRAENGMRCFVCEICGKAYFSRIILTQHMKIHTGEYVKKVQKKGRPYKCDHCDWSFAYKIKLQSHIECVHLSEI